MEARIQTFDIKLVGVQGIVYAGAAQGSGTQRSDRIQEHGTPFEVGVQALWDRLYGKLNAIGHLSKPHRAIGYWHFVDKDTRLFLAGVRVDTLRGFQWDYHYGLVSWDLGITTFATFPEQLGADSTMTLRAYQEIARLGYSYDNRFIGEFEVCPLDWVRAGHMPTNGAHEIWIPVKRVFDVC